jgi:hypothetical protein
MTADAIVATAFFFLAVTLLAYSIGRGLPVERPMPDYLYVLEAFNAQGETLAREIFDSEVLLDIRLRQCHNAGLCTTFWNAMEPMGESERNSVARL